MYTALRPPVSRILLVLLIVALSVFWSSQIVQAELIFTTVFTGTNYDIQVSNPVDMGSESLMAVTLRAVGKNGAEPSTFDSDKSGLDGLGIYTTTNALHQVWEDGVVPTPTLTLLGYWGPIDQTLDTHFLVEDGNLSIPAGLDPEEDRAASGYGTFLAGTFTDGAASGSAWDFAYLVVPSGTTVNLDFDIAAAYFDEETVSGSFVVVPEPGALVLLVMAAFGLLVFRRR